MRRSRKRLTRIIIWIISIVVVIGMGLTLVTPLLMR
jgi:cytochrome c-type biogenesis protein CcmE